MKKYLNILTLALAFAGAAAVAVPASAQTIGVSASVNAYGTVKTPGLRLGSTTRAAVIASSTAARMANEKDRAANEISSRIDALNKLISRIDGMTKLSDSEKTSLSADLQAEIGNLSSLETSINAETGTTTLKSDIQSITKAYRIYALVLPQGTIAAAADRINTLIASLTTIGTKLQTRISASASTTADVYAAFTDFNAKLSDASTQTSAAVSEVSALKPDNGDQSIQKSNLAALKDARAKIVAATHDLNDARKDAGVIVKDLRPSSVNVSATTTATTSAH
jgi:hypothetical protein